MHVGLHGVPRVDFASLGMTPDKNLASPEVTAIIPSAPASLFLRAGGKSKCGCSSVVEHLLAKEDVASSSLVTRSPLLSFS
jgi:hypothetical protein